MNIFSIDGHGLVLDLLISTLCSRHSGSGFLPLDCHIQARGEIKMSALCAISFCLIRLSEKKRRI